jgi:hypothetical protein
MRAAPAKDRLLPTERSALRSSEALPDAFQHDIDVELADDFGFDGSVACWVSATEQSERASASAARPPASAASTIWSS